MYRVVRSPVGEMSEDKLHALQMTQHSILAIQCQQLADNSLSSNNGHNSTMSIIMHAITQQNNGNCGHSNQCIVACHSNGCIVASTKQHRQWLQHSAVWIKH